MRFLIQAISCKPCLYWSCLLFMSSCVYLFEGLKHFSLDKSPLFLCVQLRKYQFQHLVKSTENNPFVGFLCADVQKSIKSGSYPNHIFKNECTIISSVLFIVSFSNNFFLKFELKLMFLGEFVVFFLCADVK